MLADIAKLHQRDQAAPRHRRRKAGARRDLAQRHFRMILVERLQNAQAAFQRGEEFRVLG